MAEVTMPRLSDTMEEGTIASWLKQPGDQVKKGDVIAQIETDKATMDLTVFEAGTLQEILAPEGSTVAIGKPVARIGSGSAASASAKAPPSSAQTPPTPAEAVPDRPTPSREAALERQTAPAPTAAEPQTVSAPAADGKVRASPMARHMAAEHGLDLARISGSGPQGRVIRADVEAVLSGPQPEAAISEPPREAAPAPAAPAAPGAEDERVPLSQMRRTIARRMAESTRTIPHFFLTTVVDATEMGILRKQINEQTAEAGIKVTFNDMVVKGVALAIRKVPEVNVSFAEDSLIVHKRVHIGVAV